MRKYALIRTVIVKGKWLGDVYEYEHELRQDFEDGQYYWYTRGLDHDKKFTSSQKAYDFLVETCKNFGNQIREEVR